MSTSYDDTYNCEDCCDGEELEPSVWPKCATCGTSLDAAGNIVGPNGLLAAGNAATDVAVPDTDDGGELDELRALMAQAQLKKNAAGATPEDLLKQLENLEHQADATTATPVDPNTGMTPTQTTIAAANAGRVMQPNGGNAWVVTLYDATTGSRSVLGIHEAHHVAEQFANEVWAELEANGTHQPATWVDAYHLQDPVGNAGIQLEEGPTFGQLGVATTQAPSANAYQPVLVLTPEQIAERERQMSLEAAQAALQQKAGRPAGRPIFARPAPEEDDQP